MSMYLWCLVFVVFLKNGILTNEDEKDTHELRSLLYKMRCTRRFSPGVCMEPIRQVWTFNYQLMNCTERLGCPKSVRSNRFTRYERCMWRCRPIVDLYLQILAYEGDNQSRFLLRKMPNPLSLKSRPPTMPPQGDYYPGDEALAAHAFYPDLEMLDDVPDIRDIEDYHEIHDPIQ